jgi:hypothetical protein
VCFIWWSLVDSYKDLNTAKFTVIHELERQLPVALFKHEWYVCGHNKNKADKDLASKYVPLTQLERWIPFAFAGLYIVLAAYSFEAKANKQEVSPAPATQHEIHQQNQ